MNPRPKSVNAIEQYLLQIHFENGEERIFDMKPYLHYPVYENLSDENVFREARVEYGTVVWNDEIDMDPDRLYLESKRAE